MFHNLYSHVVPQRIVELRRLDRRSRATAKLVSDQYAKQEKSNGNDVIRFYNWWPGTFKSMWFYQFVKNCHLLDNSSKTIRFCSVFGQREVLDFVSPDIKVFFSGENLHNPYRASYADALLCDPSCKLSLGFDCFENERYLRFPLWLTYVFEPSIEKKAITQRCEQLRYPQGLENRQVFAALVARRDVLGVRARMYESLSSIGKIDCPSSILHNSYNHYRREPHPYPHTFWLLQRLFL